MLSSFRQGLAHRLPPPLLPSGALFGLESLTNLLDYLFHFFLGRALSPGDFAAIQAVNSALLVVVTTSAVLQPALARSVAEATAGPSGVRTGATIFQAYFRCAAGLGLLLTLLVWWARQPIGRWLRVPDSVVALASAMMLLALLRPVVAATLQGRQRFAAFGATRVAFALGRLLLAVLLIAAGWGLLGATAALPLAALLALLVGLGFLGRDVWRPGLPLPPRFLSAGLRLSLAALLAYGATTALQTSDLIWVNRYFGNDLAGGYAAAVLLRRALTLLPAFVVVILFPRVVVAVAQRRLPDRLIATAALVILAPTLLLLAAYFAFGPVLLALAFGPGYSPAGALLGWMGLAALGYSLASIWLNLFLATRPWPFVTLLVAVLLLQLRLLSAFHDAIWQPLLAFALGGWLLFVGGLLLYLFWLRPALALQSGR